MSISVVLFSLWFLLLLTTLFTVDFNIVKWINKCQLTKPLSKDNESTKYQKGNYL